MSRPPAPADRLAEYLQHRAAASRAAAEGITRLTDQLDDALAPFTDLATRRAEDLDRLARVYDAAYAGVRERCASALAPAAA